MKSSKIFVSGLFAFALIASSFAMNTSSISAESGSSINSGDSPKLVKAKASNTGGTSAQEAGDSITLEFSEDTNKFAVTADNIEDEFEILSGNSFLDGADGLGDVSWSDDGKKLIIVLSDQTSLPTVKVGDKVIVKGSSIKDLDGHSVAGYAYIGGDFGTKIDDDDDSDENEIEDKDFKCGNTLRNGRLYMIGSDPTVYMVAACRLKPFRGAAVFKARGLKFENIIILTELPKDAKISDKPVLPAEGTLIKGKKDKTVWFVKKSGKRSGFTSAEVFNRLGFKFEQVQEIEDTDLNLMDTDTNIADSSKHPDGALVKCGASKEVFAVIDGVRFPFANADVFIKRGHSFEHILSVDCGRFAYKKGAPIAD